METWESTAHTWPTDAADKGIRRAYAANSVAFKAVIEALPETQRAEGQRLLSHANGELARAVQRLEQLRRLGDAEALTALLRPLIETSIASGVFDEICSDPEVDAP